MTKKNWFGIFGFFLIILSISASIFFHFPFWFSFFVLGMFIFFGSLNKRNKNPSVYSYIIDKKYSVFFKIYIAGLFFSGLVDVLYGRIIGSLWIYPYLPGLLNFLIPVFIYYPFGGFFLYEVYYFFRGFFSRRFKDQSKYIINKKIKKFIAYLLIFLLIFGAIIPVSNYFIGNNNANEIIVIFMILTFFSPDALVYTFTKKSILFSFLEVNPVEITTMFIAWFLPMILTEYPNTYSWEWIYTNVPFLNLEIAKINILIATFGWFFLVFTPIRFIDLMKIVIKDS